MEPPVAKRGWCHPLGSDLLAIVIVSFQGSVVPFGFLRADDLLLLFEAELEEAEDDVLAVGADHGVVGGAPRLEERAGEAFFMGWVQGGDSG
ncbi:hypothetical protein EYF80_036261 [Liparis tanakae]|uniref:Uncharacterized protein n=1 Tax=Liparis tanakae TaxID=230148 RepID=A0A4Z2GK21_9TELE|nr:hypothetical protein EYF80_036261 [Liparis tanakae]